MKVVCEREKLLQKINVVQKAINPKSTIPILSNILLFSEGDLLSLTGYDLQLGITTSLNCNTKQNGSITVPCTVLSELLSVWTGNEISIEVLDSPQIKVSCGKNFQKINYLDSEDYPSIPSLKEEGEIEFIIKSSILKDSLRKTMFATNPEDHRPFMGGIYMTLDGESLIFIATDGHRLSMKLNDEKTKFQSDLKAIIPLKAASEMNKILLSEDIDVKVIIKTNMLGIYFNDTSVITKLIEAKYPDYKEVIPEESKGKCTMKRIEFMNAIKASSIMAQARENKNLIKLEVKDNVLMCTANTQDLGSSYEEIVIEKEGINIKASFNSKYILDMLSVIDEDEITMEYSGSLEPAVFKTKDSKYICIVMPIRFVE